MLNEYTSPQAFSSLRENGRRIHRPGTHLAVVDHVNSTSPENFDAAEEADSALQMSYLAKNCEEFGIELFDIFDSRQGIEHIVAPEQGFVHPGMTIAAGDSHATTYGALGALGFGIGTSGIEHLLVTQTLVYQRLKPMRVTISGSTGIGITSKDVIMHIIRKIGADGATGYAIEFAGDAVETMSIEGRMTICNMAIEAGARAAVIAPDDKVFDYLRGKPFAPEGAAWKQAIRNWSELLTDPDAIFENDIKFDAGDVEPLVTWGTSPDQSVPICDPVPSPGDEPEPSKRQSMERALEYMGLHPGQPVRDIEISHAFIGSCTNARIEDLRDAATVLRGKRVHPRVRALVVPGSMIVRAQAEEEGLAQIFLDAGFEWRRAGCSLCLAMNNDILRPGERCASSTNRNFEGRQGAGARTHLMSPAMVAAAAVSGRLSDVRSMDAAAQ